MKLVDGARLYCQQIDEEVIAEGMTLSKLRVARRLEDLSGKRAQGSRRPALKASILAAFAVSLFAGACQMKDPEKCQQALDTARKAADAQDKNLVSQWREYAYKHCSEAADLERLDQDLVAKEAEAKKKALEAERKQKAQEQLVGLFQQWTATYRSTADRAGATVLCDGADDKALQKSKERFCTRERALLGKTDKFAVRYWEKEPQAARFEFASPEPVSCENFGPNRVVKQIAVPAIGGKQATRVHCEITGGVLSGLHALATQANGAKQYVFSSEYLQKDPGFAQQVN